MAADRPIRVLHVLGALNRAGAETWLMNVLRHIHRNRFRLDFLVHTTAPGAYDPEVRALGGRIFPCLGTRQPLAYARALRTILKTEGPFDVVHSHVHAFSGLVLRASRQAGVPLRIAHSHCDTSMVDDRSNVLRRAYLGLMKTWIHQHATLGLAVSRQAAVSLFGTNWSADRRWRISYCGIDLAPFRAEADRAAVRRELKIPERAFVVGHVGRFDYQKNHKFLIEIFATLARRQPDARLLLIGEGPLRSAIEEQVAWAGLQERVIFAGPRPDVPRLMTAAMDAFVLPSHFEGLPLVLLEAQAAGLPCLLADTVAEETTVNPALVRRLSLSQTTDAWCDELDALCRTLEHESRGDAVRVIEESAFNIQTGVARLQEFYREGRPFPMPASDVDSRNEAFAAADLESTEPEPVC
ncbi:MAG TPA: glycosyltransferase family 1 protein [Planctomycetaceae bacterium]|jgi:glycosyltransferase involved in cell wall biosynthesis|nr:glycosyltransferase family 1 protein [Planctomycetaceae bacterium]